MGIDPGKKGAISICPSKGKMKIYKMPVKKNEYDYKEIVKIIQEEEPDFIFLEKQHAMRGQGVVSMFTTGFGFGMLIGMINALKIDYKIIMAKTWQRFYGIKGNKKVDVKEQSFQVASSSLLSKYIPDPCIFLNRNGNPKDGFTDAVLIAFFGMKVQIGEAEIHEESKLKKKKRNAKTSKR